MKLTITQDAAEEYNKSIKGIEPKPYLRIGAKSGGCRGWMFTIGKEEQVTPTDSLFEEYGIQIIIDTDQHENLIGDLEIGYNRTNLVEQGFVFKRMFARGTLCGCGESFNGGYNHDN